MTNQTIAQTASSAPIAKLYRMCGVYNAHAKCKGSFETHSVCSCACHAKPARQQRAVKVAAPKPAAPKAPLKVSSANRKRYSTPAAPAAQVFSKAEIEANIAQLCAMVRNLRALPTA